jgi:hypothetical protein
MTSVGVSSSVTSATTILVDVVEAAEEAGPLGLCLDCNYPLQGLPTPRCPECGREFDPSNPQTMNMGRPLTAVKLWILGPLRWQVSALTWAAMGFALWHARLPGGKVRNSPALWILVAMGLLWLAWPVVRRVVGKRCGWPQSLLLRGQKQRVIVGVVLLLAAGAVWYRIPLKVGMWASRGAMDRMARELIESKQPYGEDRWVGVYKARRVKAVPGGVRFTTEDSDRTYKAGFIYLPDVNPEKPMWRSYYFLGHGWWGWREEG